MPERDLYVPPNVTTEELYRLVLTVKTDIRDTQTKLDARPTKADLDHLRERIVDLESWQTWAMRLGIPALLGIAFNLLDTFKGVG